LEILVAAAAACMVWLGWRLARRPRRVVVHDRGILDRDLGLGWISWDEIEGAWQPSLRDQQALHLKLRPGDRLARRLRRGGSSVREPGPRDESAVELRLDLTGTGLSPLELLREILARTGGRRPLPG
jgi:hypothetical protein